MLCDLPGEFPILRISVPIVLGNALTINWPHSHSLDRTRPQRAANSRVNQPRRSDRPRDL